MSKARLENQQIVVSVVICTYNGQKYLAETLESVSRQQGLLGPNAPKGIEVVMIDDHSTDDSGRIMERFQPVFENCGFAVQCIRHEVNRRTIPSYTEGVLYARGKYFKILDHDDLLASPRALAEPVEFMEAMEKRGEKVGVVFSKSLYIDGDGNLFGQKRFPYPFLPFEASSGLIGRKWGQFVLLSSPLYPFVHGASVVRKQCWEEVSAKLLKELQIGHFDVVFALYAMHSPTWRVGYLRDPSLKYRVHGSNFTATVARPGDEWVDVLNQHYEDVYGKGPVCLLAQSWNRFVQWLKGCYRRYKGAEAYKSIRLFGKPGPPSEGK